MYDLLLEMSHTVWKNGLTLSALGTALYVLLKQRKVKKRLRKFLPWILDDDSEIKEYVQNQKIIMEQLNLLLQERGIVWDAKRLGMKDYTTNGKTSSTSRWVAFFYAHFAGLRMKFNTKRGMRRMNKFKSRKFWLTVVTALLVIANDGLQLNLPSEAIMTVAGVVISYIVGESYIDGKKVNPVEEHSFDSERIDN
jgi:uncharacterized membrane protein